MSDDKRNLKSVTGRVTASNYLSLRRTQFPTGYHSRRDIRNFGQGGDHADMYCVPECDVR